MVRMHAGRAIQVQPVSDLGREAALEHRGAGSDDGADAGRTCALHHGVEVVVEARVRQVRADVGEMHACEYRSWRIDYVPVPDLSVSSASCSARSTPAAAMLSANAEPCAIIGATSHSRKQRRPPGSQIKSTRAAQFTAKSCASRSAVSRTL